MRSIFAAQAIVRDLFEQLTMEIDEAPIICRQCEFIDLHSRCASRWVAPSRGQGSGEVRRASLGIVLTVESHAGETRCRRWYFGSRKAPQDVVLAGGLDLRAIAERIESFEQPGHSQRGDSGNQYDDHHARKLPPRRDFGVLERECGTLQYRVLREHSAVPALTATAPEAHWITDCAIRSPPSSPTPASA
jgi:hypothetical protein